MEYDPERPPAQWVTQRATSHARAVWLVIGLLGVSCVVSVGLLLSPRKSVAAGVALIAVPVALRLVGRRQLDLAVRFRKGAAAERRVGETLEDLRRKGFVVMHDVEQRGEGNIDHIVSGPTGVYLVETKARGYRPEQLRKAKRQAARLHDRLGVWVTPVICIDQRGGEPFRHERVWVVPRACLLDWMLEQRNAPVPNERLAALVSS